MLFSTRLLLRNNGQHFVLQTTSRILSEVEVMVVVSVHVYYNIIYTVISTCVYRLKKHVYLRYFILITSSFVPFEFHRLYCKKMFKVIDWRLISQNYYFCSKNNKAITIDLLLRQFRREWDPIETETLLIGRWVI